MPVFPNIGSARSTRDAWAKTKRRRRAPRENEPPGATGPPGARAPSSAEAANTPEPGNALDTVAVLEMPLKLGSARPDLVAPGG